MEALLDWAFPRVCALCGGEAAAVALCVRCDEGLPWIRTPCCARCGAGLPAGPCGECEGREFSFAGATVLGRYEGRYRDLVLELKFRGARVVADELGRRLASAVAGRTDLVVPVPMGLGRLIARGYNPAELLAARVARHAGLPWKGGVLRKARRTRSQAGLDLEARLANPRGAYVAGPVRGRVLLVDDVLTTGATASACAEALREAGASEVRVAAAARATLQSGG